MKKIIFLFALLLTVGAASAKTSKLYASFTSVSGNGNISFDASTNTLKAWGANSNTYQMFSFAAGTLSNYEKLYIPIDATNFAHVRILFMNGSTTVFTGRFGSGGNKTITLSGWSSYGSTLTDEQIATITEIRIGGYDVSGYSSESPCTFSIDPANVYLESKAYEGMDVTTAIGELYWYNYSTDAEYDRSASSLKKQLSKDVAGDNQILFGPYNGNATTAYMNVAGYDYAKFTLNTAGTPGIRLMYGSETLLIETDDTKKSYTQSVTSMPKIGTIKTKNGSGSVSFNIKSIDFVKEFSAEGATAFNIAASSASTVSYDREFTVGNKSTVCLPFALTEAEADAAGTFYEFTGVDGTKLQFSKVTEPEAYKPYVFEAKVAKPFNSLSGKAIVATPATYATTVGGYVFQGTLAKGNVPNGAYGWNSTNGVFSKATSDNVTIGAFRAYIIAPNQANARGFLGVDFGDGTTGIQEIDTQNVDDDTPTYNLAGQRVNANHKGLIIKDGKKYFVK